MASARLWGSGGFAEGGFTTEITKNAQRPPRTATRPLGARREEHPAQSDSPQTHAGRERRASTALPFVAQIAPQDKRAHSEAKKTTKARGFAAFVDQSTQNDGPEDRQGMLPR
jgi:hypothetical protein